MTLVKASDPPSPSVQLNFSCNCSPIELLLRLNVLVGLVGSLAGPNAGNTLQSMLNTMPIVKVHILKILMHEIKQISGKFVVL